MWETEEIRTPASAATERCAGHYTTASILMSLHPRLVGALGFEPRLNAPKAFVLPLHNAPQYKHIILKNSSCQRKKVVITFKSIVRRALVVQWTEQRSSKAHMWVRFLPRAQCVTRVSYIGITLAFQANEWGSTPHTRSK